MLNLAERLLLIVTTLRAALGAYGRRLASAPHHAWIGTTLYAAIPAPEPLPRLAPELWTLFWNRLGRAQRRFQALYDQWRAGTLKPARVRPKRERPAATSPTPRLPRAFAWVTRRAPECGGSGGLLESLIHDPETVRFIAEVPRAARPLRPLCHALGIAQPAWLKLPPRPRKPRTSTRKEPSPLGGLSREADQGRVRGEATPALKLTDPLLNLRPYVIRAARAWKKRDGEA